MYKVFYRKSYPKPTATPAISVPFVGTKRFVIYFDLQVVNIIFVTLGWWPTKYRTLVYHTRTAKLQVVFVKVYIVEYRGAICF